MSRRFSRLAGLACAAPLSLALASVASAQSVAPDDDAKDSSGGPQASASPPGIRPARSQPAPAEALPGGRKGPPGVPQALRWTEDWSKKPADDAPFLEKIRHISLDADDDVYLSIGGEARVYYTNWKHSTLGLRANDDNDPVQTRLRLVGDLHVGPYVRAYVELGDNREHGEQFATPPNEDRIDLYQAFMDVTVPLGDAGKLTFRPGRFEMPLGNGKLVGIREGLNMRLTYQGLRTTYILPGKLSVDAFALRRSRSRRTVSTIRATPARRSRASTSARPRQSRASAPTPIGIAMTAATLPCAKARAMTSVTVGARACGSARRNSTSTWRARSSAAASPIRTFAPGASCWKPAIAGRPCR